MKSSSIWKWFRLWPHSLWQWKTKILILILVVYDGWYILEDVHLSFWSPNYFWDEENSDWNGLKDLVLVRRIREESPF